MVNIAIVHIPKVKMLFKIRSRCFHRRLQRLFFDLFEKSLYPVGILYEDKNMK